MADISSHLVAGGQRDALGTSGQLDARSFSGADQTVTPGTELSTSVANNSAQASDKSLIPTGIKAIPYVQRNALIRFYQALAVAEDNSNDQYDVEFRVREDTLADVFVHPIQVKLDAEFERGDSVCIFFSGDAPNVSG